MGQVYLAEHVKMGRKSAVKVMNPGMVHDADAISRFNREAANASRINHPNVAGIYDFGETSEGLIYLAMEFIEGESLTSLVEKQGALAPMRAANIAKQAADGLQVAHDMGIVHRDLKPDNIMIAKNRDGSDCVKVVDFGIAKAAGAENQKVTKTGLVVGTPEYMSPEQLAGDKLDGRSDVYSLALVAFNMFTGKLPFPSETAQESMIMRLTDEPKTLADMKPDIVWAPEVQAVMQRALQRRSNDRYQKAVDFGNALFMAVERMPKNAPAATMVIGAANGATSLIAPPPKTRFDANASVAGAPAPAGTIPAPVATQPAAAPAKSKTPIIAGGVAVAVAAAVTAFMIMSKSPPPRVDPIPPASQPVAGVVTNPPATQPQTPLQQSSSPAAQTGSPTVTRSNPAATNVTKSGNGSTPPVSAEVSVASRLPELLRESADDATAAKALKEAEVLQSRAVGKDQIIGLSVVRAQAYAFLDQVPKACELLNTIKERGATTPYAEKIDFLLKSC